MSSLAHPCEGGSILRAYEPPEQTETSATEQTSEQSHQALGLAVGPKAREARYFRAPGTLESAQCLAQRLALMVYRDELVCAQTASRGAHIQGNKSSEPLGPLTTTFPPSGWCLGSVPALSPPLGTEHGVSWSSPTVLTVNITSSEIVHLPLSVHMSFPSPFLQRAF